VKVVKLSSLRTARLYPQEKTLVLVSVRGWANPKATVQPEGLCRLKTPMTPPGNENATFGLQRMPQPTGYRVPHNNKQHKNALK